MMRYFVEYRDHYCQNKVRWLYVKAYSQEQVMDILSEYEIITCDQTD